MSKAPKHIEKILLGVGLLAGGALAALGVMKNGEANEAFSSSISSPRAADTSIAMAEAVRGTINSLQSDRQLTAATVPAPSLEEGVRPVDLFVGVPLYARRDNPNEPFDPVTSETIHPPIPNSWWLKYGAQPGFADSPQRDDDSDGFTNEEEWKGGTNPVNASQHPPLIAKLSYVKDESIEWIVLFGNELSGKWVPKMEAPVGEKGPKVGFAAPLNPDDLFFTDVDEDKGEGRYKNRFKFLRFEDREVMNERLNIPEKLRIAIYEDQKENKKGLTYEAQNRLPNAQKKANAQYDRTAVLDLQAIGQSGKEFKVEERTRFALPSDGEEKDYYLKEVTPEQVVVEWEENGQTRSVTIPRGGLPDYDLKSGAAR